MTGLIERQPYIEIRRTRADDPTAVALREAMNAELCRIGAGRDASEVAYTGIAYNKHRLPVGHVALHRRFFGDEPALCVEDLYVMPAYRERGVGTLLVAAAEREAAAVTEEISRHG